METAINDIKEGLAIRTVSIVTELLSRRYSEGLQLLYIGI